MHNKHSHRIVEKTAENRFLQNQPVDADEARTHHVDQDEAPPVPAAAEVPAPSNKDAAP